MLGGEKSHLQLAVGLWQGPSAKFVVPLKGET